MGPLGGNRNTIQVFWGDIQNRYFLLGDIYNFQFPQWLVLKPWVNSTTVVGKVESLWHWYQASVLSQKMRKSEKENRATYLVLIWRELIHLICILDTCWQLRGLAAGLGLQHNTGEAPPASCTTHHHHHHHHHHNQHHHWHRCIILHTNTSVFIAHIWYILAQ